MDGSWYLSAICFRFAVVFYLYIQLVDWIVHKPRTSLIVDLSFFQPTVPIKYGILHQLLQLARLLTAQKDSRRILLLCQTNVAVDGVLQSLLLVIVVLRRCMVAVSLVTKISICEGGNSKEHNDNRVRFDLIYLQQCNLVVFWWQSTMEVDVLPFWTTEDFHLPEDVIPKFLELQWSVVAICKIAKDSWLMLCSLLRCMRGNMKFNMLQCNCCCPKFCWVMAGEFNGSILMMDPMSRKTL